MKHQSQKFKYLWIQLYTNFRVFAMSTPKHKIDLNLLQFFVCRFLLNFAQFCPLQKMNIFCIFKFADIFPYFFLCPKLMTHAGFMLITIFATFINIYVLKHKPEEKVPRYPGYDETSHGNMKIICSSINIQVCSL
jgi:hypothetical protein